MRIIAIVLLFSLMWGCTSTAQVVPAAELLSGDYSDFHRVENFQQFDSALIKSPDVFAGYSQVIYAPLKVDRLEVDAARLNTGSGSWTLNSRDRKKVQRQFAEQVDYFYAKPRRFALGKSATVKTFKVAVELTKFVPNAPKDSISDRRSGSDYFTQGAGELFMQAHIYDAATGALLARLEDRRELGSSWQKNDRVNNNQRFKQGFRTWIGRIDEGVGMLNQLFGEAVN